MAVSDVEVANYALSKLGTSRIESFSQDTPNARTMNSVFQKIKTSILRSYRWNFATRRAVLAAHVSQTDWGSLNRFPLPSGFLRLIFDDETGQHVDWRIESDSTDTLFVVTTDAAPLYIKYIHDVTSPALYDSLFVEALACKLAMETCQEITGSNTKKESLREDFRQAINEAKQVGSMESTADEFPEDDWLAARR